MLVRRASLSVYILSVFCFIISGCRVINGGPESLESALSPRVVAIAQQVNGEAPNRRISVQFNADMDPASLNQNTFQLQSQTSAIPGEVTYDSPNRIASFKPIAPLATGTSYTATVTSGVADKKGQHLASNVSWSFSTRSSQDTSPLHVVAVSPMDNQQCVPQDTTVKITFNETADSSTVNTDTFKLFDGAGKPINGSVFYDLSTNTATFTPSAALAPLAFYVVNVQGAKDLADVGMDPSEFHSQFETGPCGPAPPPLAATYTSVDFPGSAGTTTLDGINDNGDMVGGFSDKAGTHGFLLSNGTFTKIEPPGAQRSSTNKISNTGDIVGSFVDSAGHSHGYLLHNGSFTTIDFPGAEFTNPAGINASGVIVGLFVIANTGSGAFIRQPDGTITKLQLPDGAGADAEDINDLGHITGLLGTEQSYLFANGTITKEQVPNGATQVNGMNNTDQLVGAYIGSTGLRGFLIDGSATFIVDPANTIESRAQDINGSKVIVGWFEDQNHATHGYIVKPAAP